MATLVIIRGLPGSGKTTLARREYPHYVHCEADDYFLDLSGVYQYDPRKIKEAHQYCFNKAYQACLSGRDVVISNTFSRQWEFQPYVELAVKYNYQLVMITTTGEYENTHGVPAEAIERMRSRWEYLVGEEK